VDIIFRNSHYNHQHDRDYDRNECTSIRRHSAGIVTTDDESEENPTFHTNSRKNWKPIHVLLIEDQPEEARLIQELLSNAPKSPFHFLLEWADRLETGLERLREHTQGYKRTSDKEPRHRLGPVDIILLDLLLPNSAGVQTFARIHDQAPHIPIIVLSGVGDQELAVQIVQAGAQDYLVKGYFDRELLIRAIRYAIQRNQTGVQVTFKHTAMKERRFTTEVETAAYRIIQEALTNIARHAGTEQVTVRVWADEEQLHIQIVGKGIGFDPEAVLQTGNSNGLNSMLERAALLEGNLIIEASAGAGTHILVELPLAPPPEGIRQPVGKGKNDGSDTIIKSPPLR